jgi:methyl-accepting chemotaxis protein
MIWTIGNKVTATGIGVLLLSVGTASVGLMMNTSLGGALDRANVSSDVLRNHMQADMMHDALRADVFAALLSSDPNNGVALSNVRTDLAGHRAIFEKSIANNTALATDSEVKAALQAVDAPLKTYVEAAANVIDLAGRDPAAAQSQMPGFLAQFTTLETAMGMAADKIEADAVRDHHAAEAAAATGQKVMIAAMIFSLLISLGLILGGVRGVVGPIRRLTEDLRAMAQGKTEVQLSEARRMDEVGDIARAVVDIQALIVARGGPGGPGRAAAPERGRRPDRRRRGALGRSAGTGDRRDRAEPGSGGDRGGRSDLPHRSTLPRRL